MRRRLPTWLALKRWPVAVRAALAVEDAGDDGVGVVRGQATHEVDRVVVGADGGDPARATARRSSSLISPPRQRSVRCAFLVSLLHAMITSSSRVRSSSLRSRSVVVAASHTPCEIGAEGEDRVALLGAAANAGACCSRRASSACGGVEFLQALLPLGLQAASDQSVLRIDGAIAAFGALGLVPGPLDLQSPLRERAVVIGFELLGGLQGGRDAGGSRARRETRWRRP